MSFKFICIFVLILVYFFNSHNISRSHVLSPLWRSVRLKTVFGTHSWHPIWRATPCATGHKLALMNITDLVAVHLLNIICGFSCEFRFLSRSHVLSPLWRSVRLKTVLATVRHTFLAPDMARDRTSVAQWVARPRTYALSDLVTVHLFQM